MPFLFPTCSFRTYPLLRKRVKVQCLEELSNSVGEYRVHEFYVVQIVGFRNSYKMLELNKRKLDTS